MVTDEARRERVCGSGSRWVECVSSMADGTGSKALFEPPVPGCLKIPKFLYVLVTIAGSWEDCLHGLFMRLYTP